MFNYLHNHYQAFLNGFSRFINNIGASVMMIIVIGITLCLPSAGLLLIENAGQISQNIEHEAEISIFLDKTVSKDQIDFIELSLIKNSLINWCAKLNISNYRC
jgi:cell division transport system permease protein